MQTPVSIPSDGLQLAGVLHVPDGVKEPRPAVVVMHGFGGNKDGETHVVEALLYEKLGYVVLRFDMRGCGESGGQPGRIICQDQVADARNVVTWLTARPEVANGRILLSGQSFGAAVGIFAGAVDIRVAGVVALGGWGDGLRKSQDQHPSAEAWERFTQTMEKGLRHREQTGESLMVKRWDIVPVPEHLRGHLPPGSIMDFTAETMASICSFRPKDVIDQLAPRPLLLLHSANDSVTPTSQAIEVFQHAGKGAELILLTEVDHFPFADGGTRLTSILQGWLARYFPLSE
ncbi:alpha/beta hydrolase [Pseudomonas sp. 14P_8.1_Bac3]|uniref:alpha/beta hydrolase n=1 Tax=Pseudomonas sp. 14P_8.1_Bac3 TaxID=2971621 RepID=UPI0021C62472|nr:alpha/beta hydrolase [Pseudomonas sp. 14P_8.1_Bac3]MCU1760897.1 alpha/beta hydrolase [Pseudomonas sp. 14P_8.1_Bac3]